MPLRPLSSPRGRKVRHWLVLVITATMAVVLLLCSSSPVARPLTIAKDVQYVQVIAHADDDLIFMNPDLAAGIRAGTPTTGIYLTGGETDKPDPQAYTARRQAGTRAAYARMAGVPDEWISQRLDIDPKHSVEHYVLRSKPYLQVIFVNLPENNDPRATGGKEALVRLWNDTRDELRVGTLIPDGGVVHQQYFYTHDDLVRLLVELFTRLRPTVVRTQDPNPDTRLLLDVPRFHDHPDHVMAARFTEEATRLYRGPQFVSVNYRDYGVTDVPPNLSAADRQDKIGIFGAYVPHDSDSSLGNPYAPWLARMYQRFPLGSTWAGDGQAYVVFDGRLYRCVPGSDWVALPWADGPVTQAVSVAGGWVVAKRTTDNAIVALVDGKWQNLGNPGQYTAGVPGQVGSPVTNGKAVYVKNGLGGLSVWRPGRGWTDIGGTDLQDGLAVAGDDVYGSTRDKVLRWHGDRLDTGFRSLPPGGPPAAAMTPGGPLVAYRTAAGDIAAGLQVLPGLAGSGNPALVVSGPRVFVVARTSAGGLAANSGSGWRDLGGQVLDSPAPFGSDAVALGPDGRVHRFTP
ncbi:PIG-L family deacetylase [Actinocrispum wychmicini]|uniref:GlcNAc-PI de-N-acetylase n=1 Tax=Actinocrispum wychmicini TaxID=1213861 RepID=A0A4R2K5W1_9PSEU|nr:PIG-L family deacetylase [Actinocrispum wychmicini]TCO65188.1 GlcNAc-PI de-N-acetylase [Actinocrispum wychmicini]